MSYNVRLVWDSVEGHMEGFRKGPNFPPFLAAIRPFIPQIDEMRHYEYLDGALAPRLTSAGGNFRGPGRATAVMHSPSQPPEPSDAEAIAASLDRPAAFDAVFERHVAAVHAFAQRRIGIDLAEDVTAETFARAFAARKRFDRDQPTARPWLLGIASNVMRRHWRTERRRLAAYAKSRRRRAAGQPADRGDRRAGGARPPAAAPARGGAAARLGRPHLRGDRPRARRPHRHRPLAPRARPPLHSPTWTGRCAPGRR